MLDPQSARAALRTYNKLIKGQSAGKSMAAELQASLRSAAAQKAEIDADLTVARTEAIIRLRPLYTAMQRAAQTGDFAAFQTAKEQYAQAFALEQAKHQATKVRAQNRINAIDNDVRTEISIAETAVKGLSPATATDNGFEDAAAETTGKVTDASSAVQDAANGAAGRESILGNAAKDEAQGPFAASTGAGNSDILNPKGIGSEQGFTEGARDYSSLVEKDKNVDVSTSAHQAVFYSGEGNRARAEAFAKLNGKTTLEMTPGGKYFDSLDLFGKNSPLTDDQAHQIWSILSERYAKGA